MPDFFAHAVSHRPIVCFVPYKDIAARIATLAQSGCGGLRVHLPGDGADQLAMLRDIDLACAAHRLSWWLSLEFTGPYAALWAETMNVGEGGAAGAWERARANREWIAARAVPLGEKGPRWSESLDLLTASAAQEMGAWNGAARLFLFSSGEQYSFWPGAAEANEALDALERISDVVRKSRAWRGLWLQLGAGQQEENESPSFPFLESLPAVFESEGRGRFSAVLPSLIADTGPAAVVDRLAFWEAAFQSAENEFWFPLRSACDALSVELAVGCAADKASAMEVRWGPMLRRYAHRVSVAPAHIDVRDNSLSIRRAASRAALDATEPPLMESTVQGRALCSGATLTVVRETEAQNAQVNLHAANMGALANWGRSGARTALLWPTKSFRSHYNPRAHRFIRWVEEDLRRAAHYLETLHFDFLLMPGGDLEHARVEEARPDDIDGGQAGRTFLRCGRAGHKFEMLVVPSITTMARVAWDKVEAFVAAGGKVVCLGLLPRWSERGRDEEMEARIGKTTMLTIADLYAAYANFETGAPDDEIMSVGYPIARSNERGGRISCYQPKLNSDPADARLRVRQLLMDSLIPTLQSQSEELLSARRLRGEEELFLLHNQSENAARINVRLAARFEEASLLWSNGGELRPVREWMTLTELEGGGLSVPLEMAGGEIGALLRRSKAADDTETLHVERSNFVVENVTAEAATGYARESCVPAASWLEGERIVTRRGAAVSVPAPLPLAWDDPEDDDAADGMPHHTSYTARALLPPDWAGCRIWLEAAGGSPFQVWVNGRHAGGCVTAPWKLDMTKWSEVGTLCEIRIEGPETDDFFVRLAAYPSVEVKRNAP